MEQLRLYTAPNTTRRNKGRTTSARGASFGFRPLEYCWLERGQVSRGDAGLLEFEVGHHRAEKLLGSEGALQIAVGSEDLGLLRQALAGRNQNDRDVAGGAVGAQEEVEMRVVDGVRQ